MQIHEITLREAEWQPLDPKKIMATAKPTRFNYGTPPVAPRVGAELPTDPAVKAQQDALSAQQAQHQQQSADAVNAMKANTVAANKVATAPKTLAPATTNPNSGANAFGQMAQQLAPQTPAGPATSSTQGTITPTATGLVHTASDRNPNPRTEPFTPQQKWDIEFRKLQNQYPGRTPQQYQQAMLQRVGTARPGGTPAPQAAPAPQSGQTVKYDPLGRQGAQNVAKTTPAVAPETQYPPITLGSGPKAQVYVNKGRGYIDSKTGKPMPPSIVKAMGIQ